MLGGITRRKHQPHQIAGYADGPRWQHNTPQTVRIISVPYGRTSDAAYRGLYHPLKAAGSRAARPVMGGARRLPRG